MAELSRLGQPDQSGWTTLDRIGAAARKAREYISPWGVVSPTDVAGFAPGGGLVQAWQDSGRGLANLKAGNYGQAAADYGSMALNTIGEVVPYAKLAAILAPAAKYGPDIWTGASHGKARGHMMRDLPDAEIDKAMSEVVSGFVDSKKGFVDRNKAFDIARREGQLLPHIMDKRGELDSAMLIGNGRTTLPPVPDELLSEYNRLQAGARISDIGNAKPQVINSTDAKVAGALPMDEAARSARASQMGFDPQTYYHATTADIDQFNLGHAGRGNTIGRNERAVFLTDSPAVADSYLPGQYINMASTDAKTYGAADMGDGVGRYYGAGSKVMPLRVRGMDDFDVWDMGGGGYRPDQMSAMLKEAKKGGAPGVIFENIRDPGMMTANGPAGNPRKPSTVVAVFDPARIRSQFAQFDPAKIKSKDILASLATLGMLGYGASQREQGGQAPQM